MHGFESVEMSAINCSARYQFLMHKSGGILQWTIARGCTHSHSMPFPGPSPGESRRKIATSLKYNSSATVGQLTDKIVEEYGCRPSLASISRHRFNEQILQESIYPR